jgi:hypothetical protein
MYKSFHIQNFRCFEDLEINDLARINLIAGKNNVGKTSFLEALLIHCGQSNPQLPPDVNNLRGAAKHISEEFFASLFKGFDPSLEIILQDERFNVRLELVHNPEEYPNASMLLTLRFEGDGIPPAVNYVGLDLQGKFMSSRSHPAQFPTIFIGSNIRGSNLKGNNQRFSDQVKLGRRTEFVSTLTQIDSRIQGVELLDFNGETMLHVVVGMNSLMPILFLGDGIERFITCLLAFGDAQNGILLIDEIENGLHYSVQTKVWKAIAKAAREFNVQVFATTHSLEMIRAAHEAFKDDDPYDFRLHRLDRINKTGKISAVTYDKEAMEATAAKNFEVRG